MPGKSLFTPAAQGPAAPRPTSATPGRKVLHTIDATFGPGSPACDIGELAAVAAAAVRAGGGHVLDSSHVIFTNGAVTLVLILAESHLAVHTWPEEDRIAIDLFSCGSIDDLRVCAELTRALRLTGVRAQQLDRGTGRAAAGPGPGQEVPGQAGSGQAGSGQAGTDSDSPN
jgi:S-adenosylmethionine decarboxylase